MKACNVRLVGRPCRVFAVFLALSSLCPPAALASAGTEVSISAGSELDYPPFSVHNDSGRADGFAVELMRAALQAMGRDVRFRIGPWRELKEDLVAGRIQALPLVARTAERDRVFDFSVPYLSMHGAIVVRKGDRRIHGAADLAGKTVLVMAGDIAGEYVLDHGLTDHLVTTVTVEEALRRLAGGEHDAVVVQKLVAKNLIRDLKLRNLETVEPPLADYQSFSFAVREGDRELLAVLNEGLAITMADGTVERLQRKWLAPLEEELPTQWLPIVGSGLASLLLAAVVAFLWQRSLVRMVRKRTAELSAANALLAHEQALRESERRFRALAENAPDLIVRFDRDMRYRYVNPVAARTIGRDPAAIVGRGIGELGVPDELVGQWEGWLREVFATGVPVRREFTFSTPDGLRWYDAQLVPEPDAGGALISVLAITRDITDHKSTQAALARRAEDLLRMNAELEEFAYVASHDLKAPLRAVSNLALIIAEDAGDALNEESREHLRLLRERVAVMDTLIAGLLSYARQGDQEQREMVPLGELLPRLVEGIGVPPGFRVEWQEPLPALYAAPLQLRQILQNLITNAVGHHDRDEGRVVIHARDDGDQWLLTIADDGPGIPVGERHRIFRMFGTGGKSGHTGIGLAVVRKLVLGNGAHIEVADNEPRGALFRIFWPKPTAVPEMQFPVLAAVSAA